MQKVEARIDDHAQCIGARRLAPNNCNGPTRCRGGARDFPSHGIVGIGRRFLRCHYAAGAPLFVQHHRRSELEEMLFQPGVFAEASKHSIGDLGGQDDLREVDELRVHHPVGCLDPQRCHRVECPRRFEGPPLRHVVGGRTVGHIDGHGDLSGARRTHRHTCGRRRHHRHRARNGAHPLAGRHQRVPTFGDRDVRRVHDVRTYLPADRLAGGGGCPRHWEVGSAHYHPDLVRCPCPIYVGIVDSWAAAPSTTARTKVAAADVGVRATA